MLVGWILLMASPQAFKDYPVITFCILLALAAVGQVVSRPDLQLSAPFGLFETRIV